MEERSNRPVADRDLRALSTADLLLLIAEDVAELDRLHPPKPKPLRKGKGSAIVGVEPETDEPEPEPLALHGVTCCGSNLGAFPAFATVRCPFCGSWQTADTFPLLAPPTQNG